MLKSTPLFNECLEASDKYRYTLLGIDLLPQKNNQIKLIEINTYPNFIHSKEVNTEVNTPFFEAAIKTMLGSSESMLERLS